MSELYDRIMEAITDEELEKYDIFFSVVNGESRLSVYEVEHE